MKTISLKAALSGFAVVAVAAGGLAYAADALQSSTKQDLMDAMKGEAFATLKYMTYADAARAHGNKELADLFDRIAQVERQEHFGEHAKMYGLAGSDADNLRNAAKGENYETTTMYPQMAGRAEKSGDKQAAKHFREVATDEMAHRDAYTLWLQKVAAE